MTEAEKKKQKDLEDKLAKQAKLNQDLTAEMAPIKEKVTKAEQAQKKAEDALTIAEGKTQDAVKAHATEKAESDKKIKELEGTITSLENQIEDLKISGEVTPEQRQKIRDEFEKELTEAAEALAAAEASDDKPKKPGMDAYIPPEQIEVGKNKVLYTRVNNDAGRLGGFTKSLAESVKQMNVAMDIGCVIKKMPSEYLPEGLDEAALDSLECHYVYTGSQIKKEVNVPLKSTDDA